MKIFRLSYFFLPYGSTSSSQAMSALKQCLHYDPDSKDCLPAHRLVKAFDKLFNKLDVALSEEKWSAVIDLLISSDPSSGFAAKFDNALAKQTSSQALALPPYIDMPRAEKTSPRRETILRALCKAYTNLRMWDKCEEYCDQLLGMDGLQNDADGLVGMGEAALKKEEWEEAVRIFEKAFEAGGRSNRDVRISQSLQNERSAEVTFWLDPSTAAKGSEAPQAIPSERLLQSIRCF